MVVEQVEFLKFEVSASKHVHEQSFRMEDDVLKPWLNDQTFLHNTKCRIEIKYMLRQAAKWSNKFTRYDVGRTCLIVRTGL